MTIDELIAILENRLHFLAVQRDAAFGRGDALTVSALDADIGTTSSSLEALRSL